MYVINSIGAFPVITSQNDCDVFALVSSEQNRPQLVLVQMA